MGSINEIATELRRIADALPVGLLRTAAELIEQAATLLAESSVGTSNPDLVQVVGTFTDAHVRAHDLLTTAIALRSSIHRIADGLAGAAASTAAPAALPDRVEQVRRSLPRGVEKAQAQGRWLGPGSDVTILRSGDGDEWHDKAKAFARSLPPPLRAAVQLARHMEVKLAIRMREEARSDETIVIDRKVCGRREFDRTAPFTCDRMLRWFLPPGACLTVVEHDGTRVTYTGEGGK